MTPILMNHLRISLTLAPVGDSHTPFQMTIGELKDELEDWPEGDEIIFGCEELEFYRFKKREPILSSWSSTRPFAKIQRQASGTSMNRLPILPICLPHLSATSCSPRCSHFATRSDSMRKPVARSFWLKPAWRIILRGPPP